MSPLATREEQTGAIYVLERHLRGRPYVERPYTNAERPDTDQFYEDGVYDDYPALKHAYEERRRRERMKINAVQDWAMKVLEAWDNDYNGPPHRREALEVVMGELWDAGSRGRTRPEICQRQRRDGGKISGAMTDLHAAGIIFPLLGERR